MSDTLYDHQTIEEKWLQFWEQEALFYGTQDQKVSHPADKLYLLFAFAYPSGSGLHVGHVESKTALDILARYSRMNGKQVFFPVGWDAFGLPAENYAIKTGVPPVETTRNAINTFRRQIKRLAISYDWANEIATCHPGYYQWTQWLFLEMYKKGLAYQAMGKVNWCPSCQTVLANEQVVNGECERCGTEVVQKEMTQWYFKITEYRDELISGLDQVDWPEPTKQQQLNWIGKKEGITITYPVIVKPGDSAAKAVGEIACFTTRPDTNFGATFIVIAPEHPFVTKILDGELEPIVDVDKIRQQINDYIEEAAGKTELERQQEGRKKSGAFTGLYAINQLTGESMPIWISDFVLAGFGTGAVVGVPGHDTRDYEFATTFDIPVVRVVVAPDGDTSSITSLDQVQEDAGTMINSEFLDGLDIMTAKDKMMDHLEKKGWGERVVNYRLRDWLISRQRYWGAPIPIVYDPEGKAHPVKEEHLPWLLPTDVEFKPTGESPLTYSQEFIERTEKLYGKGWRPEFDTMDTFVDSSWYFLRYVSARDEEAFADPQQLQKWLPVDFYMIGPEHIVLHLLYSRFFTKFLRDQGYLNFDEPFMKMRHQGMILGPDGKKMSKSKGNVINPDEVVEKFGADTLRTYEMFMGPIEADKPWDVSAVAGVYRFLNRIYRLATQTMTFLKADQVAADTATIRKLHQTVRKVSQDIPELKFNTAIAAMMEFVNVWEASQRDNKSSVLDAEQILMIIKMVAPFAPFMSEELFQSNKSAWPKSNSQAKSVHLTTWPTWDEATAQEEAVTIAIQVNGKVRGEVSISMAEVSDQEAVLKQAKQVPNVQDWLTDKKLIKEIYVPGRVINLVVA